MQNQKNDHLLIAQLFDAMPDSVIWFTAVLNEAKEVADFEVRYCNAAAGRFLRASKDEIVGVRLLDNHLIDKPYGRVVFNQCLQVWQTGTPLEDTFYNNFLGRYFHALRSKVLDGVISIARDRTDNYLAEKKQQEQTDKYNRILDASADGVWLLDAVRDENNEVVDFTLAHCNTAGCKLGKIQPGDIGKSLLQTLPHLKDSEQFNLHKRVIDTGEPIRLETTFRDQDGNEFGWFIVTLMKLGDSVVSSFVDITAKKINEQRINDQAELLNSIFEASYNAIFAADAVYDAHGKIRDLRIIKSNGAFAAMLGPKAEYVVGSLYLELFPDAKTYGFFNSYCKVIETGEVMRSEIYYGGEGIPGWFDVSAVKRGNSGIVVTFSNVTESRNQKEAIEQAAKKLQHVIDSTQTAIFLLSPVHDANGTVANFRFKTVNTVMAGYAAKTTNDLIGKYYTEIFGEDELFNKLKLALPQVHTMKRFEVQQHFQQASAWLDVSVKPLDEDLLVTFHDFTSVKKLQTEIATSVDRLNTIIQSSLAGIFSLEPVFDNEGKIEDFRFTIVNKTVADYIGETAENLRGSLGSRYFPAYKTNGLFDIYVDTYLNNTLHHFDFNYTDGYDHYFNIHCIKTGNEVLVTFTDFTTIKRLQLKLQDSVEELKNTNAQLEEFAYAASHDLQEPLRKIHYFSQRLRKIVAQNLSPEESKMFERIENAALRMSKLIDDLLIYSQINTTENNFQLVDLNKLIKQVLGDLETTISDKQAEVNVQQLPTITGDPVQLMQLFQNLLSNSLKYTCPETPPAITITSEDVKLVENEGERQFVKITIRDNGIGFEQQHAERIFKVFQRLHGQSEYPGTGIGLAIVQKVVQSHNGRIEAQSAPMQGATFSVYFPKN